MAGGKNLRVTATNAKQKTYTKVELAKTIDHTVLKPTATSRDIESGAKVAVEHKLRAFVVEPHYAKYVIKNGLLADSNVLCASVCDFPKAGSTTEMRVAAIKELLDLKVDDIDIVSKFYLIVDKNYNEFSHDTRAVIKAAQGKTLKIILESDYLDEVQIRKATSSICEIVKEEKAKNLIIKTNTGFAKEIKTENIDAVRYIKETLESYGLYAERIEDISQGKIGIKTSARIKTTDEAVLLLNAGAHIIGTSSGGEIISY